MILSSVDFDRAELPVDGQVALRSGSPPYFGPPKTDASVRTIPLPSGVTALLVEHLADFPPAALSALAQPLFTTGAGELLRRNRFRGDLAGGVCRSGARPDLAFHDLKHYYASLLIGNGESVKVVQRPLGHKTAQETLDTYGHLCPIPTAGPARRSTTNCSAGAQRGTAIADLACPLLVPAGQDMTGQEGMR